MAKYKYEGELPTFYPRFFTDGEPVVNLYAQPGDIVDFTETDEDGNVRVPPGQWAPVEPPKGASKPKTTEKVTE